MCIVASVRSLHLVQLSAEIRALLGQIGLQEGEAEQSVLSRFKGKEQTVQDDDDDGIDIAAIRDDGEDDDDAENMTPAQKRAQAKAAKREAVLAQNAAGQAKAAAAKAKLQPAEPVAPAVAPAKGKGKQNAAAAAAATPAAAGVVSLSRPKAVKEEPAARGKKVKTEDAEEEEAEEEAPKQVQAKDAFPLNNPSLPMAAPPKTIPGGVAAANLKSVRSALRCAHRQRGRAAIANAM